MTELVLVSAADETALAAEIGRIVAYLDRVGDAALADVAYTCALAHEPAVLAVVADSTAELRARLVSARARLASGGCGRLRDRSGTYYRRDHLLGEGAGRLAFVYPGVMSFYPDMLRDLVISHPECRDAFDELEEALAEEGGDFTPSSFIFPPAPYYRHDADIFSSGAYAQALVATYAAGAALTRLLRGYGLQPEGVVGFAGGDLAAMMRSGAAGAEMSRPDRVRVIREIYKVVQGAVEHLGLPRTSMLSVLTRHPGEADAAIAAMPRDKVCVAVDFSPRQKTLAVTPDYEETAIAALAACGARTMKLGLDRPFNTPKCEPLVSKVKKFACGWMKHDPICDIYSCATAERLPRSVRKSRNDTAERWSKSVRFVETIRRMYADGYRVFLEVGPRGLMTSAVEDTLKGEEHAAIAMNSIHRSGRQQLLHALAQLAAAGARLDISNGFARRGARRLDFDAAISPEVRRDTEMKLSRSFPRLTLLSGDTLLSGVSALAEPRGRGVKAAVRAAAVAAQARRQRQFDFGAVSPLVSDADTVSSSPGVSVEITKTFRLTDAPFIGDFAIGTSQLSYADPNLRGLVPLSLALGAEIMAEVAQLVMPNRTVTAVEDLLSRRMVSFAKGALTVFVRAERVASGDAKCAAVKVELRDSAAGNDYTWPAMEATVILCENPPRGVPSSVEPMAKPRNVHWSGRDIYPMRLCCGRRLRAIGFVESWSESGLDYEVTVPPLAGNVTFTRFPLWVVNPLLLGAIASGFALWRSHERFPGAFSFPFRMRRLQLRDFAAKEGAKLKCYLRLTGVTPRSHVCDIAVTDGNGNTVMEIGGWEELTERVPEAYRNLIMQPATSFLTGSMSQEFLGDPATDVSSAFVTDVPYPIFERYEELWFKTLSRIILGAQERTELDGMTGSVSRRTEWLFGRVAAKEAVRRFLKDRYQARWSDADIQIWADDSGKPHALGAWGDHLGVRLDIAIAHTAQFVVALAAANARVGVDVESVNRDLSEEFARGVFTPEELELAAQAASPAVAIIRFWCAKEAVSKALGTGIRYSPREMTVASYQADTGKLAMRLEGAWLEAFKAFRGRDIEVTVRTLHDHALAFCFIPASLFDSES